MSEGPTERQIEQHDSELADDEGRPEDEGDEASEDGEENG